MASLHCVQQSQCILGFHHPIIKPTLKLAISSLNQSPSVAVHRYKNGVRLEVSPKLKKNIIFATNNNSPEGSVVEEREKGAPKGPPFLTIVAGFLVFAAVFWVLGSIVMWLIGLVVNLSPTKLCSL